MKKNLILITAFIIAFMASNKALAVSKSKSVTPLITPATIMRSSEVTSLVNFGLEPNKEIHKYYVSISNATYNKETSSLQMVSHFFIDDMEDVLTARGDRPVTIDETTNLDDLKEALTRYLDKKLEVTVDDASAKANYLGAELESDQILLYIEIPVKQQPKKIEMSYRAFFEVFETQRNMVHFKINGQRKTLLMDINKPVDSVKIN